MTKTVTYEDAVAVLDGIVRDFGADTTYAQRYAALTGGDWQKGDSCQYRLNEQPVCIIGVAFDRLEFKYADHWEGTASISIVDFLNKQYDVNITRDASDLFWEAQTNQDNGQTWGEAVEGAKRTTATGMKA